MTLKEDLELIQVRLDNLTQVVNGPAYKRRARYIRYQVQEIRGLYNLLTYRIKVFVNGANNS